MDLLQAQPSEADPRRLELEADRTAERLRTLSLVRLATSLPDGRSRAGAAFDLAQRLADRAADLTATQQRALPELPVQAAADALAVCARDLVDVLRAASAPAAGAEAACRESVAELIALRRLL